MNIIGLTGLAGSGKSTAAKYLIEQGYTLVKFAKPLKDMLRAIGLSEEEIEGSLKEKPCDILQGKTPRHAMITLGTEWGRDMIGKEFWHSFWVRQALQILVDGGKVVCDDVRFENEWKALKNVGGVVFHVVRDGAGVHTDHTNHISEKGGLPADYYLTNNRTIENFHFKLLGLIGKNAINCKT